MANMALVMSMLKSRHRVVLAVKKPGKESDMSKSKKAATKKAAGVKKQGKKGHAISPATHSILTGEPKEPAKKEGGKMSGLDAAAQVLREAGKPMNCKELVQQILAKGLWTTKGATPASTIYSAVLREITNKKEASRFRKAGPGKFELAK